MAINPVQIPGYVAPQSLDFSPLANLGKVYNDAQIKQARQQTLAQLGQGSGPLDYTDAARKLFAAGDSEGAMSLATLGATQQQRKDAEARDTRDFAFRQQESGRAQGNADRTFDVQKSTLEGQRVPSGWQRTQSGLAPVAGGPEDPAYLRQKAEATDKGRALTVTDIGKLNDEGQKFSNLTGFISNFKDDYAGYKVPMAGNAAMAAGRYLPEAVVGKDIGEAAGFWQGYDRYKNIVRNDLFGSALTASEQAAFEKADIGPGMDPTQIKRNLSMQKNIVENGLKRKASAMVEAGYNPKAIGAAYGVDLGSIGVPTQRGGQVAAPSQSGAPKQINSAAERDALPSGAQYISPDGQVRTKP